jgi:hypothetical protein
LPSASAYFASLERLVLAVGTLLGGCIEPPV